LETQNHKEEVQTNVIDKTTSEINDILEEDNQETYEIKEFKETVDKFNEEVFNILANDEGPPQEEAKKLIGEIFEFQGKYYQKLNKLLDLNLSFKCLLIDYFQKYRKMLKKYNNLREKAENNKIKNTLMINISREGNDRLNESIKSNQKEMKIFQQMFNIKYNDNDIKASKPVDKTQLNNEEKQLMTKALQNIMNDDKIANIPQNKRENIESICLKLKIPLKPRIDDAKETEETVDNKHEEAKKDENLETKSKINSNYYQERNDPIEFALNEFIVDFFLKAKIPNIPFARLKQGYYKYGSQKVGVKLEDNKLKVGSGNSWFPIKKYIELNAIKEEYKNIKSKL